MAPCNGWEPADDIRLSNLHRRHLTESQRAMVAAKLANMAVGGDGSNQHESKSANLQNSKVSQSDAAKLLNVSTRSERRAGELIKEMQEEGRLAGQGGDRKSESQPAILILSDVGLTADQSSRFQRVAKLTEEEIEDLAEECDTKGEELTQALAIRTANGSHVSHNSGENEWYTPKE